MKVENDRFCEECEVLLLPTEDDVCEWCAAEEDDEE